jgi:Fe-S oxidoreductase
LLSIYWNGYYAHMAKPKAPRMGRPLSEDRPLVHRVCGYFSADENAELVKRAARMTKAEGTRVTVAEVVRRAVRAFIASE